MKYETRIGISPNGEEFINIIATDEGGNELVIPADSNNSDYQRYLRHLAGEDESGTLS